MRALEKIREDIKNFHLTKMAGGINEARDSVVAELMALVRAHRDDIIIDFAVAYLAADWEPSIREWPRQITDLQLIEQFDPETGLTKFWFQPRPPRVHPEDQRIVETEGSL